MKTKARQFAAVSIHYHTGGIDANGFMCILDGVMCICAAFWGNK